MVKIKPHHSQRVKINICSSFHGLDLIQMPMNGQDQHPLAHGPLRSILIVHKWSRSNLIIHTWPKSNLVTTGWFGSTLIAHQCLRLDQVAQIWSPSDYYKSWFFTLIFWLKIQSNWTLDVLHFSENGLINHFMLETWLLKFQSHKHLTFYTLAKMDKSFMLETRLLKLQSHLTPDLLHSSGKGLLVYVRNLIKSTMIEMTKMLVDSSCGWLPIHLINPTWWC
jgi:hypothetical protein